MLIRNAFTDHHAVPQNPLVMCTDLFRHTPAVLIAHR